MNTLELTGVIAKKLKTAYSGERGFLIVSMKIASFFSCKYEQCMSLFFLSCKQNEIKKEPETIIINNLVIILLRIQLCTWKFYH